jgi:hypothetical protein
MSKELKKATFREIRVARTKEPRKMKKIASGIILVLLISMLLLSGSSHSTESTSFAGVEKAINFLIHKQFNQSVGLCRESNFAPNVYWLVSDNLWAWKALKVANETYYFGAGDVGRVADEIEAKLKEDATLYNLPRDRNGFPISFMHEAVIGDVIPTPNRTSTILTLHSDDYIVKTEICNGTTMFDWHEYADRLLYKALSCHWEGNDTAANLYFKNATETWDRIGISDIATKADGLYATYKLALLLYTSKVLGRKLPFECELVKRIWSLQRKSDGGIMTNYYANGTLVGDANTETTSIVIIALLTPPRARLGTFAFYYPWYGNASDNWSHWNGNGTDHNPDNIIDGRRDIAATDYPLLGAYDSNDETVIEKHVKWAKEAGIDCFVISWWGINDFTDNASKHIKNVCERDDFEFTFYVENTSEHYNKTPSINQTVNDITYLFNTYGNSSSFYKIDGRPVIFVYAKARDSLNSEAWIWHACTDSIGIDTNPNQNESASSQWLLAEEVREPPRFGIVPFQPFNTTPGYVESSSPIHLQSGEEYWLNVGVSDIKNDSDKWSDVGVRIKIGLDASCSDTLYDQVVNFTDGWHDLNFSITSYAGQDVYIRAESYNGGLVNWSSEWAAADYFFINNSKGEIVSPDPFFDNGWKGVINNVTEHGANPYVIMDFGGYENKTKIQDFMEYFSGFIDGIHMYYPLGFSNNTLKVYDLYHEACELAHSYGKTFIATVVPGFNNVVASDYSPAALESVVDRRNGVCYSSFWLIAKASHPDGYAITSFNEWHEGTEIEPSREYGYRYISLTRYNSARHRNLLAYYNYLLGKFDALNLSYQQHLLDYSSLQRNYTSLQNNFSELLADFNTLNASYQQDLLNYTALQTSYANLQEDFNSLNMSYISLNSSCQALNSSCNNLNASFNDYKTSTQDDLSYTRDLVYVLTTITVILIVAIVYVAIRKPRIKPEAHQSHSYSP